MPSDDRMKAIVLIGDEAGGLTRVGVNPRNVTTITVSRGGETLHDVDVYFVCGEKLYVTVWHPRGVAGIVDQINHEMATRTQ